MDWVPAPVVIEPEPVPIPPPVAPRFRPGLRRPRWVDDEDRPLLHTPVGMPGPAWSATLPARFEIPATMIRYAPPKLD